MASSASLRRWSRAVGIFRSLIPGCGRESHVSESTVVGCGRGWVAVFNKRINHLFLSDPISHRITDLPPIHTLPDPGINRSVSKVVLSSSPKDDECRAMMMFGPTNRLAFCLPGHSSAWTPIGDHFFESDYSEPFDFERYARVHEDLVYCTRRKVFTTITAGNLNPRHFFFDHVISKFAAERCDLDIQDPNSPKIVRSDTSIATKDLEGKTVIWAEENHELLKNECIQIAHLVYAEQSDQLFLVMRFVRLVDGSARPLGFVPRREDDGGLKGLLLGRTYGFIVMELMNCAENDKRQSRWCNSDYKMEVVEDLNRMAMFVGVNNHSFAIPIHHHHHQLFNPNSIYFTDAKRIQRVSGVNDTGVFDYATKTISPISPSLYHPLSHDDDAPTQSAYGTTLICSLVYFLFDYFLIN